MNRTVDGRARWGESEWMYSRCVSGGPQSLIEAVVATGTKERDPADSSSSGSGSKHPIVVSFEPSCPRHCFKQTLAQPAVMGKHADKQKRKTRKPCRQRRPRRPKSPRMPRVGSSTRPKSCQMHSVGRGMLKNTSAAAAPAAAHLAAATHVRTAPPRPASPHLGPPRPTSAHLGPPLMLLPMLVHKKAVRQLRRGPQRLVLGGREPRRRPVPHEHLPAKGIHTGGVHRVALQLRLQGKPLDRALERVRHCSRAECSRAEVLESGREGKCNGTKH
jgi:hypothetical protein